MYRAYKQYKIMSKISLFDVEKDVHNDHIWPTISPYIEVLWTSILDVR